MDQLSLPLMMTVPSAAKGYRPLNETRDAKRLPLYNAKAARVTGIMQITSGAFAFFLEVIMLLNLEYKNETDKVAIGVWGGPMFIASGIVGLLSVKKTQGMIVAYLVMSIVSCVISGVGTIFASIHLSRHFYGHGNYHDVYWAACLVFLVTMVIEGFASMFASSFGCASQICCDASSVDNERVVHIVAPPGTSQANESGGKIPQERPPAYIFQTKTV